MASRYKRLFFWRHEDGTATVELAIAAPLLLFVTLTAFNLADAGQKKALLSRAAMEGGRLAVVKGNQHDVIDDYVKRIMKNADPTIDTSRIHTKVENSNPIPVLNSIIKPVKVTVQYDVPIVAWFEWSPKIRLKKSYTYEQWDNGILFDVP